jgi:hypothetical protein
MVSFQGEIPKDRLATCGSQVARIWEACAATFWERPAQEFNTKSAKSYCIVKTPQEAMEAARLIFLNLALLHSNTFGERLCSFHIPSHLFKGGGTSGMRGQGPEVWGDPPTLRACYSSGTRQRNSGMSGYSFSGASNYSSRTLGSLQLLWRLKWQLPNPRIFTTSVEA